MGGVNQVPVEVENYIMKLHAERFIGVMLPVLAGCLLFQLLATAPAMAQYQYSGRIIDLDSPLSQDIMVAVNEHVPNLPLADIELIARDLQLASQDYSLEPGLLVSLMAGEDMYAGYPQARLYYFNLDMGSLADEAIFPVAWFDAERVARAYSAEYERYEDKTSAIAAYYLGSRALPPDGDIQALGDGIRELVSEVLRMDAEYSHLGERSGPQVVQPDESTPESSFDEIEYDFTEIERDYIENMMYFNQSLDEPTAQEIFIAISTYAAQYPTVDARLVMALVAAESAFRPDAVSRCGALGLGQLMPFTAEGFGICDPFNIDDNIRGTFTYLDREIARWAEYNYPLDRVLAAYNAGPSAVQRYTDAPHHGIPPYEETVNYVRRVINYYFYLLPEGERAEKLNGYTRHVTETDGSVQLAQ